MSDTEKNFRMSEVHHALFLKSAQGLLLIEQQLITLANPAAATMLGYTVQELTDLPFNVLLGDKRLDDPADLCPSFREKNPGMDRVFFDFTKKNGEPLHVEISACEQIPSKTGTAVMMLFNNITERKEIENSAQTEEQKLRLFIEHAPAAIAIFDTEMKYLAVSNRWMEDYELGSKNIIGLSHYEVFPGIPDEWKDLHQRGLAGERFEPREGHFQRADGRTDWVKWQLYPWYTAAQSIGGIILFTEVITKRVLAEKALRELNSSLEKKVLERTAELTYALEREKSINEMKSRFVSMASHEFRTPLSTLLSSAFILQKYLDPLPGSKEKKHLDRIKASVDQLTSILEDFLSLDKLESGKIQARSESFDLKQAIGNIVEDMKGILKKGQTILFSYKGREEIVQDRNIIRNTVYNLLSNAIKFSEQDKPIRLDIEVSAKTIQINVSDEGIGIPGDEQDAMFSRLFRAKNALNIPGTGLGLNIVKGYIDLVGGTIGFRNRENAGTIFTVEIPLKDQEDSIHPATPASSLIRKISQKQ